MIIISYNIFSFNICSGYDFNWKLFFIKPEIGLLFSEWNKNMEIVETYPNYGDIRKTVNISDAGISEISLLATLSVGIRF